MSQFTELLRPLANNGSGPAAPGVGDLVGGKDAGDDEASLASSEDRDPEEDLDMVWDQRRTRLQMAGSLVEKGGAGKEPGKKGPAVIAGKEPLRKRPLSAGSTPPLKKVATAPAGHLETGLVASADNDSRTAKALSQYN